MEALEKHLNEVKLEEAVQSKKGFVAAILRKIWPLIRSLILEIAISLLEDQRERDFGKLASGEDLSQLTTVPGNNLPRMQNPPPPPLKPSK